VVKNKVAPPFKQAEFDIMYGEGISRIGDLVDIGVGLNQINKSGAWYSYNGDRLGQGRENAKEYLRDHPDLMKEIDEKIREILRNGNKRDKANNSEEMESKSDIPG
jgi:recombination protein RecA